MHASHSLVVTALLLHLARPAAAEFFGIPLPELVGPAPTYGGPPIEVSFDFGREFEHVENVMIMMQATTTPLVLEPCVLSATGVASDPGACDGRIFQLGFFLRLEGPPFQSTTAVVEGFREPITVQPPTSTQPRPEKRAGVFDRTFGDFSFDHLNDGTGTLRLWWNQIYFLTDGSGQRGGSQVPTGTIIDAVLIVEATPRTPEQPAAIQIEIEPSSGVGAFRLALLGSDTFDVREVDVATLRFGPAGAHASGPGIQRDVNRDGWTDLVSRHRRVATGLAPGDTEACLGGETLDGTPFEGCDAIEARHGRSLERP